ncbi:MAG: DNA methyltransferase [bacterium]
MKGNAVQEAGDGMQDIQHAVCSEPEFRLDEGEVVERLDAAPQASCQAALADPPYGLGIYGEGWDQKVPGRRTWRALARVLEPGAWAIVFGHPRTHHRLMTAMEDGGLELRDVLLWLFGTGFPKGRTTVRPAWQPMILGRRPGPFRPLNIDGCRTGGVVLAKDRRTSARGRRTFWRTEGAERRGPRHDPRGRWPANLMLDHAPGCTPEACWPGCPVELLGGEEGIPRFFWCAKAAGEETRNNPHPTKKPVLLTEELARLLHLEERRRLVVPFCGSGSELVGGVRAGWPEVWGIEGDPGWLPIAEGRLLDEGAKRWSR